RWIRHPRDVFRLTNAVKFSWPALQGEIDPRDLFALEGLRLFDEHIFHWIRWNRDFLFHEGRYFMADKDAGEGPLKALLDKIPDIDRQAVFNVLAVLFPHKRKHFGDRSQGEQHFETVRRRGVGCEAGYDAYFALYPSPNAIPKAVIDSAMAMLNN